MGGCSLSLLSPARLRREGQRVSRGVLWWDVGFWEGPSSHRVENGLEGAVLEVRDWARGYCQGEDVVACTKVAAVGMETRSIRQGLERWDRLGLMWG